MMLHSRDIRTLHRFREALGEIANAPQNDRCKSEIRLVVEEIRETDFWHNSTYAPIILIGIQISTLMTAEAGKYTRSLALMARIVEGDLTALLLRLQREARERPFGVKVPTVPAKPAPHEPEKDWDL